MYKTKDLSMYNIISLSHIDLDGISCQLLLDQAYTNIKQYNCNYNDISEYLEYIDDNCSEFRPSKVFITDLSFEIKYAIQLAHIIKHHSNIEFIYIDHHPYKDDLLEVFNKMKALSNFKFIHSIKASATKLTYMYLSKSFTFKNAKIESYVEAVNAYDLWLLDSDMFKVGFVYNTLFFSYKIKPFFFEFRDLFSLKEKHKVLYKDIVKQKDEYFLKLRENKLIFEDGDKIFLFADEHKGWITLEFPNFDYYVIASTYGGMSVRISKNISEEKASEIKHYIIENKDMTQVSNIGGHDRAFGLKIESPTIDLMIMHVQDLSKLLDKIT
jgi:oligoribonuclease NrnB/cAMP/cGMP phosphodiesterase (DHH superfamily)